MIVNLIKRKRKPCNRTYSIFITKLSNYHVSNQKSQQLKLSSDFCFDGENKRIWIFLATNMEPLAGSIKCHVGHENLKHFLPGYTAVFTNNIYTTKDCTFHNLRGMIQNKLTVLLKMIMILVWLY